MLRPLYLDLFDDGIPPPGTNPLSPTLRDPFVRRIADTLRFQILLAALFERRIVVPGAWAVSSPMFLALMREVAEATPSAVSREGATGRIAVDPFVPLVLAFGDEAPHGTPAQRLVQSLAWRLREGRRLMFSHTLAAPGRLAKADEAQLRGQLADALDLLRPDPVRMAREVPMKLEAALLGAGEGGVAAQVRRAFATLLPALDRPGWAAAMNFDKARYDAAIGREVLRVRDAALALRDEAPVDGFVSFFGATRDARPEEIMALWARLAPMDLPAEDKHALEAFGRCALSRAYAATLGAGELAAVSFEAYARERTRPVDELVLRRTLAPGGRDTNAAGTDFVSLASGQIYDLADTIDWSAVWPVVADLATRPSWRADRDRLLDPLRACSPQERERPERWAELFDRLNAELVHVLELESRSSAAGEGLVAITRKTMGAAATAARGLGLGATVTVPLAALGLLAGRAEPRQLAWLRFKAERRYRELVTSRTFGAVQSMLATVA